MTRVAAAASTDSQAATLDRNDHVVKSGETLSGIAAEKGVSLDALIAANPQITNPNLIRPGEEVRIPDGASATASTRQTYTVQRGDTLSEIGERFGVDWRILAQANGLTNPNLILPNQELRISGGGSVSTQGANPTQATTPTGQAQAPQAASGTEAGRIRQAMDYFVGQGWSPDQAAGIVANLQRESGLRIGAVGDGGQAYGLAQWHPDRQANFARFAGHSIRESTFAEQLAFVHHEMTQGAEVSAGNRLRGADDAGTAGSIVSRYYERPADRDGEAAHRAATARQILNGY